MAIYTTELFTVNVQQTLSNSETILVNREIKTSRCTFFRIGGIRKISTYFLHKALLPDRRRKFNEFEAN